MCAWLRFGVDIICLNILCFKQFPLRPSSHSKPEFVRAELSNLCAFLLHLNILRGGQPPVKAGQKPAKIKEFQFTLVREKTNINASVGNTIPGKVREMAGNLTKTGEWSPRF